MDNLIYRSIGTFDNVADENSRTIRGLAIVFDSLSREMRDENGHSFVERVSKDAITEDFLVSQDVIMNVDHDNSRMLARYNHGEGTLRLSVTDAGVAFEFEAPETALGDEVLYNVRHNNLFECSFACIINKNDITEYREEGQRVHVIERISALLDCSIVVHAAYPATEVEARSLEMDIKAAEQAEIERKAAEEAENERKQQILNSLNDKLNEFYKNI